MQEWRDAKKAVEEVQKKIETLITALETDYGAEAKQAATKAKANVTAVTDAVKEVRKSTSVKAINTAKATVATAIKTAKETLAKAVETAKKAEKRSKLPAKTLIYGTADGKYHTLSGEMVDRFSLLGTEISVPGLPLGYTVLKKGGKFCVRGAGGARIPVKDAPAGGENKTRYSVYRGGYVYYSKIS